MNISLSALKNIGVGIVILGGFLYTLYLGYDMLVLQVPAGSVNASLLGPRLQKAATVIQSAEKISFKKSVLQFTETPLYASFVDVPEAVPLSDKRGREDPFVPLNQ
jgi:hypothetical protein